ncbi:glycosyltransferase family 39 protein [Candidatus Woesearchaeota archaeon]|nr:glycosyltransferase family 39 protein [Candidatus Woesearchaeota archaeon]
MLLGIMHQTNDSVYWTLKFFNALLVSLSIIFFYFFARALTNSPRTALFAAFAMFSMPAHLSHFIWAISITMPLFFVSFYSIEKVKDDKRWWIISAVAIAATVTSACCRACRLSFVLYFVVAADDNEAWLRGHFKRVGAVRNYCFDNAWHRRPGLHDGGFCFCKKRQYDKQPNRNRVCALFARTCRACAVDWQISRGIQKK